MIIILFVTLMVSSVLSVPQRSLFIRHPPPRPIVYHQSNVIQQAGPSNFGGFSSVSQPGVPRAVLGHQPIVTHHGSPTFGGQVPVQRGIYQQPLQTHAKLIELPQQHSSHLGSNFISQPGAYHRPIPAPFVPSTTVSTIQTIGQSIPVNRHSAPFGPQHVPVTHHSHQGQRISGPHTYRRVVTIRQQPLMVQPNYYVAQAPSAPPPQSVAAQQNARRAHLQALSEVLHEYEPNVLID